MDRCLTKKLLFREVSGCLVDKPECEFAHRFGFSFVCRHPDHAKFQALAAEVLTRNEIFEKYETLRLKRRDEFLAGLDEETRRYFSLKLDFHGQPLTFFETAKSGELIFLNDEHELAAQ